MERNDLILQPAGDNGILISFGTEISTAVHNRIRCFITQLENNKSEFEVIIEIIPAYTTLLIIYDPTIVQYEDLLRKLISLEGESKDMQQPAIEVVHIPVVYGGSYGPDLSCVASHNKLSKDEVIDIHTDGKYLIYMMGFTPGFPYLGGMSEKISTPRLEIPREKIPAGSVGIAGNQTGVYPIDSPGGWQIIGRTPLKLFNPNSNEASLLKAGQYIKFYSIDEDGYNRISQEVLGNSYKVKITSLKEADTNA